MINNQQESFICSFKRLLWLRSIDLNYYFFIDHLFDSCKNLLYAVAQRQPKFESLIMIFIFIIRVYQYAWRSHIAMSALCLLVFNTIIVWINGRTCGFISPTLRFISEVYHLSINVMQPKNLIAPSSPQNCLKRSFRLNIYYFIHSNIHPILMPFVYAWIVDCIHTWLVPRKQCFVQRTRQSIKIITFEIIFHWKQTKWKRPPFVWVLSHACYTTWTGIFSHGKEHSCCAIWNNVEMIFCIVELIAFYQAHGFKLWSKLLVKLNLKQVLSRQIRKLHVDP